MEQTPGEVYLKDKLSSTLSDKVENCYVGADHYHPNGGRTKLTVLQCQSQSDEAGESNCGPLLSAPQTACALSSYQQYGSDRKVIKG